MFKVVEYINNNGQHLVFHKYIVNEQGVIKNKRTNRILKYYDKDGYYKINLSNDNNQTVKLYVHRIVLSTFLPDEYFAEATTNHINEDKHDNNINNLEWLSSYDNNVYGTKLQRLSEAMKGKTKTKEQINKFIKSKQKRVAQYTLDGVFVRFWDSATVAGKESNFTQSGINSCCLGKIKKHKGFIFRYE